MRLSNWRKRQRSVVDRLNGNKSREMFAFKELIDVQLSASSATSPSTFWKQICASRLPAGRSKTRIITHTKQSAQPEQLAIGEKKWQGQKSLYIALALERPMAPPRCATFWAARALISRKWRTLACRCRRASQSQPRFATPTTLRAGMAVGCPKDIPNNN